MGLFEPAADCATLMTSPGIAVYQDGSKVPITTTIVTRTNEMNLIGMYKIFKPSFDEVFFVLSRSGNAEADGLIDERVCDYDNVLCVGRDEQMFRNTEELRGMVRSLTEKFKLRFYPKYFASLMDPVRLDEEGAVARLLEMNNAVKKMQIEAPEVRCSRRRRTRNDGSDDRRKERRRQAARRRYQRRQHRRCSKVATTAGTSLLLREHGLRSQHQFLNIGDLPGKRVPARNNRITSDQQPG
jgi:hypothetical protein